MILRNNFRIKSKIRFTIFIALMLIFTTMLCNAFMSLDFAQGEAITKFTTVKVMSSETLWDIANAYSDGKSDIRDMIYKIKKHNKIKDNTLLPGQIIKIPTS